MRNVLSRVVAIVLVFAASDAVAATEKSVVFILGKEAGWQEAVYADDGSARVHYEYNDRGRGPKLDATFAVAKDGTFDALSIQGVAYFKTAVDESFVRDGDGTRWKNASEDEKREGRVVGHYLGLSSVPEEFALLARALLAAKDHRLALLPVGEAHIAEAETLDVKGRDGRRAKAVLYAIEGLDLTPSYVWLDDDRRFFATYSDWQSQVRGGYEDALPALGAAQGKVERRHVEARAKALTHRLRGALVVDDVRVFDPQTLAVAESQRVVVEGGRVRAVGPAASTPAPDGAERMDGGGRFLMPGLWDMHVHVSGANDGILNIASGVTTVRDLANDREALLARIEGYESGADVGPRVIRAGFVDGRGPYAGPTKVFADTPEEGRAAIEQFSKDGFEQVKLYSSLKPELVPEMIRLAHAKGMRVSGHVPNGMTARQFVEAGADELQHANFLFLNFLADSTVDTRTPQRFSVVADRAVDVPLGGKPMQDFIGLLRERGTVVDPTLVTFEQMFLERPGVMAPTYFATVARFPIGFQRWLRAATGGLTVSTKANDVAHRESYRRMIDLVGLLHRSGVTIVAGTDAFPLFALARELELYVHAGIPPAEVLRIATLDAARVMKRDREYGRVAPGYVADFILVDGDPTRLITDVRNVHTVVRGDRWFEPAKLYEALGIRAD